MGMKVDSVFFLLVPSRSSNLTLAFLCCKTTNSNLTLTKENKVKLNLTQLQAKSNISNSNPTSC